MVCEVGVTIGWRSRHGKPHGGVRWRTPGRHEGEGRGALVGSGSPTDRICNRLPEGYAVEAGWGWRVGDAGRSHERDGRWDASHRPAAKEPPCEDTVNALTPRIGTPEAAVESRAFCHRPNDLTAL